MKGMTDQELRALSNGDVIEVASCMPRLDATEKTLWRLAGRKIINGTLHLSFSIYWMNCQIGKETLEVPCD